MRLHRMGVPAIIELMLGEESGISAALFAERRKIARGVRMVVRAFQAGGRLFYVGAGTSGRLGVLDASECPPTFQSDPDQVQGIIAGGRRALWKAVEGAEDDPASGAAAIRFRGAGRGDVVVGIAASGRTPFVWGALREAKRSGAVTILIGFNPHHRIAREDRPALTICPAIGPEILTGSTRLKAGTATKLILNMLTTASMVRTGKVRSNLMIDLKPSNAKLRDRSVRIARELTGAESSDAIRALRRSGWSIARAVDALLRGRKS
jgi:N-acetylmuramic acid 6-phosphate etherase